MAIYQAINDRYEIVIMSQCSKVGGQNIDQCLEWASSADLFEVNSALKI